MKIAARIQRLQKERLAALGTAETLITKAADEDRDLDEAEQTAYDESLANIEAIDAQLDKLLKAEKLLANTAVPAGAERNAPADADDDDLDDEHTAHLRTARPGARTTEQPEVFKGAAFTRAAIALGLTNGIPSEAERVAKRRWPEHTIVRHVIRAATDAISTEEATGAGGGSNLVTTQQAQQEFIELLRPLLIVNRIPGMRRMDFGQDGSIEIPKQTGGVGGGYVGEGGSIMVERLDFGQVALTPSEMAVIVPVTNKQLRKSNPSMEQLIRDDMLEGTARTVDTNFLSDQAAGANPAGILNGVAKNALADIGVAPTVTAVTDAVRLHRRRLRAANIPMSQPVWIMSDATEDFLMLQRTTSEERFEWKDELEGGRWLNTPVVSSTNVNAAVGGVAGDKYLVLMDGSQVIWADELAPQIEISKEAVIQSDTAPATPPDMTVPERLNAFQQNMTFFKLTLGHSWARRRDEGVSWAISKE